MKPVSQGCGEPQLEKIVSWVLMGGVIISLLFEIAGLVLFYRANGNLHIVLGDNAVFVQGRNFFIFLYQTFSLPGIHSRAIFFMTAGMVTLILTPYAMVITSLLYFLHHRNYRYVFITGFIVIIISISLGLH